MDIGWCITKKEYELLYQQPTPVINTVLNEYKGSLKQCIGLNDFWDNVFSINAPFDISFKFRKEDNKVIINEKLTPVNISKIDNFMTNDDNNYEKYPIIQIHLHQFFVADKPCIATFMPPIFELDSNEMWNNIRLVSGKFNIYDWHRPINFAFEWKNYDDPITIRKGSPLMYMILNSENLEDKFKLKTLDFDKKVKESYDRCVGARDIITRGTRHLLHRNREQRDPNMVSKCPFHKMKFW